MYDFEVREVPIYLKSAREKISAFLKENGLRIAEMSYYLGVYDEEDNLVAGGGCMDNVIKCIAVLPRMRDYNLSGTLITRLRDYVRSMGYDDIFVFTKAENEGVFRSLSFFTVGKTDKTVMLESNPLSLRRYKKYLSGFKVDGINGCIVMNCNPFTKGHRYLIEQCAKRVDKLHVVLVKEGETMFPYKDRIALVMQGVADLKNVDVIEGSSYVISAATFPNYFIKNLDEVSVEQVKLDLDVFVRHIAPSLGVSVRFMGSEPTDELTALYNKKMHEILPANGIEAVELHRFTVEDVPVSASAVRRAIRERRFSDLEQWLPKSTLEYFKKYADK